MSWIVIYAFDLWFWYVDHRLPLKANEDKLNGRLDTLASIPFDEHLRTNVTFENLEILVEEKNFWYMWL